MSVSMRRNMGATLFLLAKTMQSTATLGRPSWARVYSTSMCARGGEIQEIVEDDGEASTSLDPFEHLPRIEPSLLTIKRNPSPAKKQAKDTLVFGNTFTDHMLSIDWDTQNGWHGPEIIPYGALSISPAASSLHYGLQCFEGMKAYKDAAGNVRLFRPELNIRRFNRSMARLHFPTVDEGVMIQLLSKLVMEDVDWIPEGDGFSLYIRPTAISSHPFLGVAPAESMKMYVILSPVGPYYQEGFKPVRLYADTMNTRAWPGGMGFAKAGGNYAPTIQPAVRAQEEHGCAQVLWLFGDEHYITEVGAMNIFFLIQKEDGSGAELITSPLDAGDILDGVTRRSVLELAKEWCKLEHVAEARKMNLVVSERRLTMGEVVRASKQGRLLEVFGTGTAAVVAPVRSIKYQGLEIQVPTGADIGPFANRIWEVLTDIQYGRMEHPWSVIISGRQ